MNRETVIQIRVSFAEKAEIERRAARRGKKPSEFIRDVCLQGASFEVERTENRVKASLIAGHE